MAGELQLSFSTGRTVYALIRSRTAQIWNTSGGTGAFENYNSSVYTSYSVSLTEQGTASAFYAGTFPSAIPAGIYSVTGKTQLAGSPAETDPTVAIGDLQWNGTVTLPLSDLSTSGQLGQLSPIRLARGTQIRNFPIYLVSAVDHVTPFTSGVVSGQIARDGGSFTAFQSGAFTEKGQGFYTLQAATSGDLLGDTACMLFTAVGISGGAADPRPLTFLLQRSSGV